jgi:NADH dehydrogenase FAD-containing subunit
MKVVIIGGGYVGCELAKSIDPFADVVLIDQKEAFIHTAGMIRGLLDKDIAKLSVIPYDNLLARGTFIQGDVEEVGINKVTLTGGRTIEADVIVVATGSFHSTVFKTNGDSIETFMARHNGAADELAAAKTVAIVGAGAVGVELAGEIAATKSGKEIHLISAQGTMFPAYTGDLHKKLIDRLTDMGVKIHLNCKVRELADWVVPHKGKVKLNSDVTIDADIIFPATGSRANASLLKCIEDVTYDELGRAKTDQFLRPSASRPNLFIAGDILSTKNGMTIVALSRQVPWLSAVLKSRNSGKEITTVKPYTPWKVPPILLPLGRTKGASALPFGAKGFAVGDFLTSQIKGKELFIPKYQKLLGHKS